jgi:hypothetical protein
MKISKAAWIFLALVATALTGSTCLGGDDDDFQFWSHWNLAIDLSKGWTFTFEEQLRVGDDASRLTRHQSDFGVIYHNLAEWLDLGVNYRVLEDRRGSEEWERRDMGYVNVTFLGRIFGQDFKNRLRFEYESRDRIDDFGTIRNQFTLNAPFELHPRREKIKVYTVRPYASYELFYDTVDDRINRHRIRAGLSGRWSTNVVTNIYYMRQQGTSSLEENLNVLGFRLRLMF